MSDKCNRCGTGPGTRQIIPPISEAIHWNHRGTDEGGTISFSDALGRDGGCQGCHPAHRSDGVTDGYPITLDGDNFEANGDNRLASGGCFVGRDVHSNPLKDVDGAGTPEYLNAVGQWLQDNVSNNQAGLAGDPVQVAAERVDLRAGLADHDAGAGGVDVHLDLAAMLGDLDLGEARVRELALDVIADRL